MQRGREFWAEFWNGRLATLFGGAASFTGLVGFAAFVFDPKIPLALKWALLGSALCALVLRGAWVAGLLAGRERWLPPTPSDSTTAPALYDAQPLLRSVRAAPGDRDGFRDFVRQRLDESLSKLDPNGVRKVVLVVWTREKRSLWRRRQGRFTATYCAGKFEKGLTLEEYGHLASVEASADVSPHCEPIHPGVTRGDLSTLQYAFGAICSCQIRSDHRTIALLSLLTRPDGAAPNEADRIWLESLANSLSAAWQIFLLRRTVASLEANQASESGSTDEPEVTDDESDS